MLKIPLQEVKNNTPNNPLFTYYNIIVNYNSCMTVKVKINIKINRKEIIGNGTATNIFSFKRVKGLEKHLCGQTGFFN